MKRKLSVFVGGIALMVISTLLAKYSQIFIAIFFGIALILYIYYELTLSPEAKLERKIRREKRRMERERAIEEMRKIRLTQRLATAGALGTSYGFNMGLQKAKDEIRRRRQGGGSVLAPLLFEKVNKTDYNNFKKGQAKFNKLIWKL